MTRFVWPREVDDAALPKRYLPPSSISLDSPSDCSSLVLQSWVQNLRDIVSFVLSVVGTQASPLLTSASPLMTSGQPWARRLNSSCAQPVSQPSESVTFGKQEACIGVAWLQNPRAGSFMASVSFYQAGSITLLYGDPLYFVTVTTLLPAIAWQVDIKLLRGRFDAQNGHLKGLVYHLFFYEWAHYLGSLPWCTLPS